MAPGGRVNVREGDRRPAYERGVGCEHPPHQVLEEHFLNEPAGRSASRPDTSHYLPSVTKTSFIQGRPWVMLYAPTLKFLTRLLMPQREFGTVRIAARRTSAMMVWIWK